ATGADEEDARREQLQLPLLADLGDEEMPAVPLALGGVERARQLGGEAAALPVGVAAGERGDVLVTELAERLRRERRSGAARAVQEDRSGAVGRRLLDPRLEEPARDVDRAGDASLGPLVQLADVDEQRPVTVGGGENLSRAREVDLVDLGLHLLEHVAIARHSFHKDSGWRRARLARDERSGPRGDRGRAGGGP